MTTMRSTPISRTILASGKGISADLADDEEALFGDAGGRRARPTSKSTAPCRARRL